eukprot:c18946_g1_i1 orf=51-1865(+)
MFIRSDCFSLPHRPCLSFIFLCQLTWILPCIFFLLIPSPAPRMLVLLDRNVSTHIHSQGVAGPLKVFADADLSTLKTIHDKWSTMWPKLRENFIGKGFGPPAERTCFIWLPECYELAKHERIQNIVKELIGPNALLYGMSVWDKENEALQRFHRDAEVVGCQKSLNFVSGTSVQLLGQSHKLSERLLQAVLKHLQSIEEESFKYPNKPKQLAFLQKLFTLRVKRIVRTPDIQLESFEGKDGDGVFFNGGSIFRLGDVMGDRRGLLLQFISADCKVRDSRHHSWGIQGTSHSLYMPPVLLVTGTMMESSAFNDVRVALAKEETVRLKLGDPEAVGSFLRSEREPNGNGKPSEVHKVKVFLEPNASITWQERGIWRFQLVGEASTTVIALGRIEQFRFKERFLATEFHNVAGDGKQVVVVLSEGMIYSRSANDDKYHYSELLELRPGSAVLLPRNIKHALKPLRPDTAFMSFRWVGYGDEKFSEKPQFIDHFKFHENPFHNKEPLGHGYTQATEGRTITLSSGQAYDPDNNENCDVIVFVIEGNLLQILPSNVTLQSLDVLLVPTDQSCVLWNIGTKPVKFFAMHLCHFKDAMQITTSFGASGKVF